MLDIKTCSTCKIEKPFSEFWKNRRNVNGIQSSCKTCHGKITKLWRVNNNDRYKWLMEKMNSDRKEKGYYRTWHLRDKFGIIVDQYKEILNSQGGGCAICRSTFPARRQSFHIDHDYLTGEIRGLLCHNCNRGIGYLQDSIKILQKSIQYLSKKLVSVK